MIGAIPEEISGGQIGRGRAMAELAQPLVATPEASGASPAPPEAGAPSSEAPASAPAARTPVPDEPASFKWVVRPELKKPAKDLDAVA